MELVCQVQNFLWGKRGRSSAVARLAHENSGIEVCEEKTYAEFWMGVHPSGPSYVKSSNISLSQHLGDHATELGLKATKCFGNQLPFLFKVLSIETALSIQAHPSKSHAEELFKVFPQIYKDNNHKPELAIALTQFEGLCGFRPQSEIKHFLSKIPEFALLIKPQKIQAFLEAPDGNLDEMKDCFQNLMSCSETAARKAVDQLLMRLDNLDEATRAVFHADLLKRINQQFPGDIGLLCIYWLNYLVLNPGEALYMAPNEPHAYLHGDCVECMANSDNVVRAGLTPKFRDVRTLCDMLTYRSYKPNEIYFQPTTEDDFCQVFRPPVNDFAVAKITLPAEIKYSLNKRCSASILLVIQGQGKVNSNIDLKPGTVLYFPSMFECDVKCIDNLVLFQAFCNV